jgi:membrane fusion protein, peptide pheromone/bacteriocin exporter
MSISLDPINTLENLLSKNKTKSFSIYLVVILAIIVFCALLPIIKVDVSSQSRGIVRSVTDNVPVTSLVSGRITFCNLRNNTCVQKGDTLLKISQQTSEVERKLQDTLLEINNKLRNDLNFVLNGKTNGITTQSVQKELYKFQSQKNELNSKLLLAQTNFNRQKILFDKGIIARAEFEKYEFDFNIAKQTLQSLVAQQKVVWQNQKLELENQSKNIIGSVSKIKTESNNYAILSPISGTIENGLGLQTGSFVNASQNIANISPSNNLIVECTVSPSDIGLIRNNQVVKFQFDAFNYNQWGLLEGKVFHINNNITVQQNEAFFVVRCLLNSRELQLKSGYKATVSKGMTLTTRYIISRRSLFDLLFDKVDDWLNPKILK